MIASAPGNTTVIVPALNEIRTIVQVVSGLVELGFHRVIVVDDGSSDGTGEAVDALHLSRVMVLYNPLPTGKGAAVIRALACVDTPYVAMQDADLEYPAAQLVRLLGSDCDMVVGCRQLDRAATGMSLQSLCVNRLFSWLLASPDPFSGQRVLKTDFMAGLGLRSAGFAIETEIVLKATAARARTRYVAVAYFPRTREEGKKIGAADFFKICGTYLSYRWQARRRPSAARCGSSS